MNLLNTDGFLSLWEKYSKSNIKCAALHRLLSEPITILNLQPEEGMDVTS
jgi:hypothetical protein